MSDWYRVELTVQPTTLMVQATSAEEAYDIAMQHHNLLESYVECEDVYLVPKKHVSFFKDKADQVIES